MEIEYNITADDTRSFWSERTKDDPNNRILQAIYFAILVIFLFSDIIVALILGTIDLSKDLVFFNLVLRFMLWIFILVGVYFALNYYSVKAIKQAIKDVAPDGDKKCKMILEPEGFWSASDAGVSFLSWNAVTEIRETVSFYNITMQGMYVYYIPKRSVPPEIGEKLLETARYYRENAKDKFLPSQLDLEIWRQHKNSAAPSIFPKDE